MKMSCRNGDSAKFRAKWRNMFCILKNEGTFRIIVFKNAFAHHYNAINIDDANKCYEIRQAMLIRV